MSNKENKIKDRILKMAQNKKRLELKERLLKEKARKLKNQKSIRIGNLIAKFGLEDFEEAVLLGAFAEMKDRSRESGTVEKWRERGKIISKNNEQPLLVALGKTPTEELKRALKESKFRWNSFRKEWQGYGIKEKIEALTWEFGGKVEVVGD